MLFDPPKQAVEVLGVGEGLCEVLLVPLDRLVSSNPTKMNISQLCKILEKIQLREVST